MSNKGYRPLEVAGELRREAAKQHGHLETMDGDELRHEYRAAITLEQQHALILLLGGTLASIEAELGSRKGLGVQAAKRLARAALDQRVGNVPTAISTEDGDVAWVERTPITQTKTQAIAALKANGMWTVEPVEPPGAMTVDEATKVEVHGYEVLHQAWMVPCLISGGDDPVPLLTRAAVEQAEREHQPEDIVFYEQTDVRDPAEANAVMAAETGAWWWHCEEVTEERWRADGDEDLTE